MAKAQITITFEEADGFTTDLPALARRMGHWFEMNLLDNDELDRIIGNDEVTTQITTVIEDGQP